MLVAVVIASWAAGFGVDRWALRHYGRHTLPAIAVRAGTVLTLFCLTAAAGLIERG